MDNCDSTGRSTMETEYAAGPCNSLIPAFSFPTKYKTDKKMLNTSSFYLILHIHFLT